MTLPEVLLWQELRKRPGGLKFRRQHPAGFYILDFYCPAANLAVEVDGEVHNRADRPDHDDRRAQWLLAQNVRLCRVQAKDIFGDMDAVMRQILDVALHPSTSFAGPPPLAGED